ncbi:MAG TPA: aminoacyl-histidine dipeptidase [Candidatus Limnocylindrales bacterium]|nr:aminoacyl-histidine dipeptidase [Candidatus Limnocylindrales bacterium]
MIPALANLKPEQLWKHFDSLAAIPRASTKEAAARDYVRGVAKKLGLETQQDPAGNLIVRKPARPGRESAPMALLQGHLDMVCEKNESTVHNFDKDPIKVLRDGDWLKADGTTLGSDNGVGVAAALAVMESTDISHGPLEFAFTIDEETGLTGASDFAPDILKSKYFLNLDTEEIGNLCIGCAGGVNTTARRKVKLLAPSAGSAWRIKVTGLRGGHSGVDIHQGRGNALRIMGGVLQDLLERLPAEFAGVNGGSAHNAIPREAVAVIVLPPAHENELKSIVATAEAANKAELGSFDSGLQIIVEKADRPEKVMDDADAKCTAALLATMPHGILFMSPDVPGLVQTSTNLAVVSTKGDVVEIVSSQRSAILTSKQAAARMVATVCRLAGFEAQHSGSYPGWKPEPNNELIRKLQEVHKKLFGEPAKLIAMHAGLECGVIGEKYPGMQLVSFGPTIVDPHSPNERVQISTVESFWKFLKQVLEDL